MLPRRTFVRGRTLRLAFFAAASRSFRREARFFAASRSARSAARRARARVLPLRAFLVAAEPLFRGAHHTIFRLLVICDAAVTLGGGVAIGWGPGW